MRILLLFFVLLSFSGICFGQTINYENLKKLIGERISDLDEYYKITPTKIDDNFGNLTVSYDEVKVGDYLANILVKTEGKNIKQITVTNTENRTSFFLNVAAEIEKATHAKKNYKTIYISLVKNSTKRKIYFDSVLDLVETLKKPSTNLKENYGFIESNTLNTNMIINENLSLVVIN